MKDRMIKPWEAKIINIMGFIIIIFLEIMAYIYGIENVKKLGDLLIRKYDETHNNL